MKLHFSTQFYFDWLSSRTLLSFFSLLFQEKTVWLIDFQDKILFPLKDQSFKSSFKMKTLKWIQKSFHSAIGVLIKTFLFFIITILPDKTFPLINETFQRSDSVLIALRLLIHSVPAGTRAKNFSILST